MKVSFGEDLYGVLLRQAWWRGFFIGAGLVGGILAALIYLVLP